MIEKSISIVFTHTLIDENVGLEREFSFFDTKTIHQKAEIWAFHWKVSVGITRNIPFELPTMLFFTISFIIIIQSIVLDSLFPSTFNSISIYVMHRLQNNSNTAISAHSNRMTQNAFINNNAILSVNWTHKNAHTAYRLQSTETQHPLGAKVCEARCYSINSHMKTTKKIRHCQFAWPNMKLRETKHSHSRWRKSHLYLTHTHTLFCIQH